MKTFSFFIEYSAAIEYAMVFDVDNGYKFGSKYNGNTSFKVDMSLLGLDIIEIKEPFELLKYVCKSFEFLEQEKDETFFALVTRIMIDEKEVKDKFFLNYGNNRNIDVIECNGNDEATNYYNMIFAEHQEDRKGMVEPQCECRDCSEKFTPTKFYLENDDDLDVVFYGEKLSTVSSSPDKESEHYSGTPGRYESLTLYRTIYGSYVAQKEGHSTREGERKVLKSVMVCDDGDDVVRFFGPGRLAKRLYKACDEHIEAVIFVGPRKVEQKEDFSDLGKCEGFGNSASMN